MWTLHKKCSRVAAVILAIMVIISMMPAAAFAGESQSAAATYKATFLGHSAQVNSFKVYTYDGGKKGTEDLLEGVEDSDTSTTQQYNTQLAAGDYWLEGYDANNEYNGGLKITVSADGANQFKVLRAYNIKASNSGWVLGTDYTLEAEVSDEQRNVRESEMGTATPWGDTYASCLCLYGDTIKITYKPTEKRLAENYIEQTKSQTLTLNSTSFSVSIPQAVGVTFEVPEGAVVSAGKFHTYYIYDFEKPVEVDTPKGENATYKFNVPKGTTWFYRVQHKDGVTYWNYQSWSSDTTVKVTEEDLNIGSKEFTKDTIYRYDKNVYDRADIYLNINNAGYMDMEVGGSYQLNVFRNWMAIESYMNSKVGLPDMHYEVTDVDGNPSDIVEITADKNNSSVADMVAKKKGTAIVKVTYDAMTHVAGQGGKQFSAIWPECTGVFVVTVGEGKNDIDTGMKIERYTSDPTIIDAEHDILFYSKNEGDTGASYTFKPEDGTTVTVARSSVGETMEFHGFDSKGVSKKEDGTVTVTGLTTGRHIIKVEKGGKATYQVVTARGVTYEIQDKSGNKLTDEQLKGLKAGDTVCLQFTNLVNPAEKLSGAYNFNARILYYGEDNTAFSKNAGPYGEYDFSGNPAKQTVTIRIPKYWEKTSYTVDGLIAMAGYANVPIGGHRGITYEKGLNAGFDSPNVSNNLSVMPEITFDLQSTEFLKGTLKFKDSEGKAVDAKKLNVTLKDSEGIEMDFNEDGTFKCLPEKYSYTVKGAGYEYTSGSVDVTEENTVFEITLNKVEDTSWDGTSKTEPEKDADGVYLIKTGNEMAWFADTVNTTNQSISGKLQADINLAKHPWTPIGSNSKRFKGSFDGNGYKITGLSINESTTYVGLFGYAAGGAKLENIDVSGTVCSNYSGGSTCATAGILAYAYGTTSNKVQITNCINRADVSQTKLKNYLGGIVGYGQCVKITGCINTGDLSGANYIGGIIGKTYNGALIQGVYNTGNVTGKSSFVAGIAGHWESAKGDYLKDAYNIGTVTASEKATYTGAVFGRLTDSTKCTVERAYYLDTLRTDGYAKALSEKELKWADLDTNYFGGVCDGYSALLWEKNVKFHKVVTNKTAFYTDYTCDACKAHKRVWTDERLQYIDGLEDTLTSMEIGDTNASYPWSFNKETKRFESTYAPGSESSTGLSETCFTFETKEDTIVTFGYGVSSTNDNFTLVLKSADGEEKIAEALAGDKKESYGTALKAGETYSIIASFETKANSGSDAAWIQNMKFQKEAAVKEAAANVDALIDAIGTVSLENGNEKISAARTAYDKLGEFEQTYVKNYEVLSSAEKTYAELETKLAEDKETAKENFVKYADSKDPADYRAAQQEELKAAKEAGVKAIEAAKTEKELDAAYSNAKNSVAKIKTDLVLQAEEAKDAAEKAKVEAEMLLEKAIAASISSTDLSGSRKTATSVTLKWDKVSGVQGYVISRSTTKNGEKEGVKVIKGNKTTSWTNTKLTCGKTYYYTVSAYKEVNGKTYIGEASNTFSITAKPVKSTIKKITAKKKAVELQWNKQTQGNGYKIYRATSKNGKYTLVKTVKSANTVKYTNKGLKSGKRYYYKVRAYKIVDGKTVYGNYSTVKSVKTK